LRRGRSADRREAPERHATGSLAGLGLRIARLVAVAPELLGIGAAAAGLLLGEVPRDLGVSFRESAISSSFVLAPAPRVDVLRTAQPGPTGDEHIGLEEPVAHDPDRVAGSVAAIMGQARLPETDAREGVREQRTDDAWRTAAVDVLFDVVIGIGNR